MSYQFTSQTPFRAPWAPDDTGFFCQGSVYVKSVWLPNDSDAPDADPEARPGRLAPVLPQYAT